MSKPGCFGAASIHSHDSDVCLNCAHYTECSGAVLETLREIESVINVQGLLKRHAATRVVAKRRQAEADAKADAELPPGNVPAKSINAPVIRKTAQEAVRFEVSETDGQVIARLPVKSKEVAIRLCEAGILQNLGAAVAKGENPFETAGPAYLRVTVKTLMAGSLTKRSLREAFETELGWKEGTAASHVSIALGVLQSFGLIQEMDGQFSLKVAA